MENGDNTTTPEIISMIQPLPPLYDAEDSRVVEILDTVAAFCGKEFTEVPQNPDEEPGVPVPLAEEEEETKPQPGDPDFTIDPDDPDKTGQIDPDVPGTQPDHNTSDDTLDKLREEYQAALAKNLEEKQKYWAMLWQVIRLLSSMGCWTESSDDTFIIQYRIQQYAAEQVNSCCKSCCKCDEDVITIPIEYAPVEKRFGEDGKVDETLQAKPFIKAVISVVVKGQTLTEVISQEYLNDHYDQFTETLYINREDFPNLLYGPKNECCCLCERKLTITLYYNAGYYTIPQAILPLVCQLMGKIEDSKKPLSDCTAAVTQVSGLLKSMKTGNIQYAWSDNDNNLANTQALFTEIYNIASIAELFSLSRCDIVSVEDAGDVI